MDVVSATYVIACQHAKADTVLVCCCSPSGIWESAGWLIDSEGTVATVFHVCDHGTPGSITYTITLSTGHVWNAKYRGGSKQFDVAVLTVCIAIEYPVGVACACVHSLVLAAHSPVPDERMQARTHTHTHTHIAA